MSFYLDFHSRLPVAQTIMPRSAYVGERDATLAAAVNANRQPPTKDTVASRVGARLLPVKNTVNLFRQQRKQVQSVYSIDVPKDTLYLQVDHGKVSPVDSTYAAAARATSPVSDMSNDDSSLEIRPPVPLKSAGRTLVNKDRRTSTMPRGLSAKAQEWVAPASRFSWTTQATSVNARDATTQRELPRLPESSEGTSPHLDSQIPTSRFSWTTYSTEPQQHLPLSPDTSPNLAQLPEEPRSRFSWTTNNTTSTPVTKAESHMAPASPTSMRRKPLSPPPSPPSVMSRSRPIARPDAHLNVIKRKPTPSEIPATPGAHQGSPSSDNNKELPLSPPELESVDAITSLQVQINQMTQRRFNLEKAITSTASLQLQSPLVADLAKRKSNKEQLAKLEAELSEVRRQEHELGLKLHRAHRRRDQEAPSGLWVRRVTT